MPFDLALRPTVINGNRYRSDFIVVWKSDFGERRVGRIRRSDSSNLNSVWVYHLQADIPVPLSGNGRADSLKAAQAAFRNAFERFCADAGDLQGAFRAPP
jgi:hypothetical protein